jgi:hypothetical protein
MNIPRLARKRRRSSVLSPHCHDPRLRTKLKHGYWHETRAQALGRSLRSALKAFLPRDLIGMVLQYAEVTLQPCEVLFQRRLDEWGAYSMAVSRDRVFLLLLGQEESLWLLDTEHGRQRRIRDPRFAGRAHAWSSIHANTTSCCSTVFLNVDRAVYRGLPTPGLEYVSWKPWDNGVFHGTVLAVDKDVIVCDYVVGLVACDPKHPRKQHWRLDSLEAQWISETRCAVLSKSELIVLTRVQVMFLNALTGQLFHRWNHGIGGLFDHTQRLAVLNDTVYIMTEDTIEMFQRYSGKRLGHLEIQDGRAIGVQGQSLLVCTRSSVQRFW